MTASRLAVAPLAALLAGFLSPPRQEADPTPTARLLGIEEYRLPNGLRVVLLPDATKPKFTANLTILVGSIHEGAGEAGMAHVFEHVLFRNLEGFPDVKETLKNLGANYNGSTSFERTNFFETVNASEENLETVIKLEAARLGRAHLSAEDLEKEGKIVEGEFDIGQSFPQTLLFLRGLGVMYDFHAYGRAPIGTVEDFKALKIENIRPFYKRYYRPDNAVLFLAGKFDKAKALALIRRHFGDLKGTGEGRPVYATRDPGAIGERRYVLRRPGDASLILVGYRIPGAASPDAVAADVLSKMLSSDNAGPLYEAVVAKGLASEVSVDSLGLRMPSPYFAFATVPKDKDPDAAEAAMIEVLEKKVASLTAADLERAKGLVERDYDRIFNNTETLATLLSEYEAAGSWKLFIVHREQAKAVTLDAVKTFAAKYLRTENRVVGRFIPDDAAAVVAPEKEPDIQHYQELLAKVPAGTKAVKEFSYAPAHLQASLSWVNVGSAKIGLIRKEVKGDDVHVRLWIPFAGRAVVAPALSSGEALAQLMTERTRSLSRGDLSKKLAELKSKIDVAATLEGASISIRSKKDHLPEVVRLATEMVRTPFIEEQQLKEYVTRLEGKLKSMKDDPSMLGVLIQGELSRLLYPEGDPRRRVAIEKQIQEVQGLTVESLASFHKSFFGADGLVGSAVGEVSPEEVARSFSPLVQGWKSEKPFALEPSAGIDRVATAHAKVPTPGKPNAFSLLVQPVRMALTSPDHAAMQCVSWALFEDPLGSRIPKRIREEAALSYATGGQFVTEAPGDMGLIVVFTATKPENAEKALGLIRTEMEKCLKEGITAGELESYKKAYRNQKAAQRSNDLLIAAAIVEFRRAGLDFNFWVRRDEEAAGLTLDKVNEVARRYLDPTKAGLLQIGDFR